MKRDRLKDTIITFQARQLIASSMIVTPEGELSALHPKMIIRELNPQEVLILTDE